MNQLLTVLSGILAALAISWAGLVYGPVSQLGSLKPETEVGEPYPVDRIGLAKQGADVYRANGCYYCHSQQVRQGPVSYELFVTVTGTNDPAISKVFSTFKINLDSENSAAIQQALFLASDDFTVWPDAKGKESAAAEKLRDGMKDSSKLKSIGLAGINDTNKLAKALDFLKIPKQDKLENQIKGASVPIYDAAKQWSEIRPAMQELKRAGMTVKIIPTQQTAGDIPTFGMRQSVARDYLFDSPAMIGSRRVGPDLANIGVRRPDTAWHLTHLYKPKLEDAKSKMPRYSHLFETRKIVGAPASDALKKVEVANGYEIVPKPEALALVAYLQSLKQDKPLPESPIVNLPIHSKP